MGRMTTVIVIGDGVAGMSAAHEPSSAVTVRVFERQDLHGGKARSVSVDGTGTETEGPAREHGFRFTRASIPHHRHDGPDPVSDHSAADNLVQASRDEIAINAAHRRVGCRRGSRDRSPTCE